MPRFWLESQLYIYIYLNRAEIPNLQVFVDLEANIGWGSETTGVFHSPIE